MKPVDIVAILLALGAGIVWSAGRDSSPDPQTVVSLPPLSADDPADAAIINFIGHYAEMMAEQSPRFAARIREGEFTGNGAAAAQAYHGISDDARSAAQEMIKQHVNKIQDDPAAVAQYAEESAQGWEQVRQLCARALHHGDTEARR